MHTQTQQIHFCVSKFSSCALVQFCTQFLIDYFTDCEMLNSKNQVSLVQRPDSGNIHFYVSSMQTKRIKECVEMYLCR